MKKQLLTVLVSLLLTTTAYAGSLGFGVSGNIAQVGADGTETEGAVGVAGTETESSQNRAMAANTVAFGSVFAEYTFGDSEIFTIGVDYIPGSADINSATLSRADASQGAEVAQDTGTLKANAEISDHITYYAELGRMNGIYGKVGFAQVDIDVKQNNSTGYGTYPDKTLDAIVFGLGYKGEMGTSGYYKIEGFRYDYDSYQGTSTSANGHKVNADIDVTGAKFAVGYKF